MKQHTLIVMIALATLALAACSPRVTTRVLSAEKGEAFATEVDEIVENMIVGISENNYAKYSRDMDERYLKNYASSLLDVAEEISSKFGAYKSKTFDHAESRQLRRVVIYHLAFENEPDVYLEVFFSVFDSRHITGTYWNSE